ncbi:MAG: helix-turn-helix domain-containing protein [Patescibacteria group bacterium]
MRSDKHKALTLRLKGHSYSEISEALGIPKSTLSTWFSETILSTKAQNNLQKKTYIGTLHGIIERNKKQTHDAIARMRSTRASSAKEIKVLSRNELKYVGAALYWAEGYKRPHIRQGKERTYHSVALTNSDPFLVAMFMRFLREVCEVPDNTIRVDVRIYEHMNEGTVLKYWQKMTQLPSRNFGKFYYGVSLSSRHKRPHARLPYGTVQIRVNNTPLFHRIMGWIQGLGEQIK